MLSNCTDRHSCSHIGGNSNQTFCVAHPPAAKCEQPKCSRPQNRNHVKSTIYSLVQLQSPTIEHLRVAVHEAMSRDIKKTWITSLNKIMIQTSASITSTMAARTLSPNAFAAWLTMQRHTISMQMTTQDDTFPDFYTILDVSEEADEATIKKAFMRAILVNHPDKQAYMANDQERAAATQRTQSLVHAKGVLFDAEQRTEYDKERNRRKTMQCHQHLPSPLLPTSAWRKHGKCGSVSSLMHSYTSATVELAARTCSTSYALFSHQYWERRNGAKWGFV